MDIPQAGNDKLTRVKINLLYAIKFKICYNSHMQNNINIEFKQSTIDDLVGFSELLNKDVNVIIEEALAQYFESEQKKLIEKGIEEDASMTNLDYDEFWDGLDIG